MHDFIDEKIITSMVAKAASGIRGGSTALATETVVSFLVGC